MNSLKLTIFYENISVDSEDGINHNRVSHDTIVTYIFCWFTHSVIKPTIYKLQTKFMKFRLYYTYFIIRNWQPFATKCPYTLGF